MRCSSLQEAARVTITESKKPPKTIAIELGIPYPTLMSYTYEPGQNDAARGLPARLIVPITISTRNPAILDFLEHCIGRLAFEIPSIDSAPDEEILKLAGAIAKEVGEAISKMGESVMDGKVTPIEAAITINEIHEAIRELARAAKALEHLR